MSLKIMSIVWDLPIKSHTQKLVLLALADCCDHAGYCFPSIRYLAEKCSLSRQGVMDQLRSLQEGGILTLVKRGNSHRSNYYHFNGVPTDEEWTELHPKPEVNGVDRSSQPCLPVRSTALTSASNGIGQIRHDPSSDPSSNQKVIEIYESYPRKVGKPDALKAISKSVQKFGADFILAKTREYAAARVGQDPQFTPHPSTWFNQERFNDDPSTWKKKVVQEAKVDDSATVMGIMRRNGLL